MSDDRQVSWMAIPERTPVVDKDENELGRVDAVLGDDEDGIFHGIALNLKGLAGVVELPAERVTRIEVDRVYTDLTAEEADELPKLEQDRWYEFDGVSRILKRVKWGKDE